MAVSFNSRYLSATKFTSDEVVVERSALLSNVTLLGNLTLGETILTPAQVANLAAHSENNPQTYITGDYQGVLPSTYETHRLEFYDVQNEVRNLKTTIDVHDTTIESIKTNTSSINVLYEEISNLNHTFANVPDYTAVLGTATLIPKLRNTNLSEVLGDVSSFDVTTNIVSTLKDLESKVATQTQSLNTYQTSTIGTLDNSGNIGTNVAPGKTLIHCIGDLDAYGDVNLISQFNVTKTNVEMTKDKVDIIESDLSNVIDDVALLKMAESGAFGDATALWNFVGTMYNVQDNTRDGWYPLFNSYEDAIFFLNTLSDNLNSKLKYTLSSIDYSNLFQEIVKFKVVTIGPIQMQQPHIYTAQWTGDEDVDAVYHTVAYDNGALLSHNGQITYMSSRGSVTTEIEELFSNINRYPTILKDRISRIETDLKKYKNILGPIELLDTSIIENCRNMNADSTILFSELKFNHCHPNLFQKQHIKFDNFLLFGLNDPIRFHHSDIEKVYCINGRNENADVISSIRSGEQVDIIFNFLIGPIPHTAQFNLYFFLNENADKYFGLQFRWKVGNIHTIQLIKNDDNGEYAAQSDVINRFNPIHFLQMKYSTHHQKFTGITSTRHITQDTPIVAEINLPVGREYILDWIESVGRRVKIEHYNDPEHNLNPYNFHITGLAITTQN